jgi:hypothetical protein
MRFQEQVWASLRANLPQTHFGKHHGLHPNASLADFQQKVPVRTYEELYPWIERSLRGEANVLWPGVVKWFSKSSGTTNDVSKYIPITPVNLHTCHYKAGRDLAALYLSSRPGSKLFSGKTFTIGGSHTVSPFNPQARVGDVSAVLMENLPAYFKWRRAPSARTALMSEWEGKIAAMLREITQEPITALMGVPTWTLVLLRKLLEQHPGPRDVRRLLPRLEVFFHGAVSFVPYRAQFEELIPHPDMWYWESYNASEGFFATQALRSPKGNGMMLLADHGVFFEFMPLAELGKPHPNTKVLAEVEAGELYAPVISTNGGLWRYLIGDTIKFTQTNPWELVVAGRTKHFINAFGEEVVVENTDQAVAAACQATGARIREYTAAPIYFAGDEKGGHEWLLEFEQEPQDVQAFMELVDAHIQTVNSDYAAKRYQSIALGFPLYRVLPPGTFLEWMRRRGKLGGQNKVPRLANNREYVDSILGMLADHLPESH